MSELAAGWALLRGLSCWYVVGRNAGVGVRVCNVAGLAAFAVAESGLLLTGRVWGDGLWMWVVLEIGVVGVSGWDLGSAAFLGL